MTGLEGKAGSKAWGKSAASFLARIPRAAGGLWKDRAATGDSRMGDVERSFLPAALEVLETPPSPGGRLLARALMAFFAIGVVWACAGQVDIIATAGGKIIPSGRVKQVQPLNK
ncbi:MAG TPA: hypothetical protein PK545_03380, partial [Deltaproteobacteria bacterium]|nr:hypothetical protein [Deltaproteobacteria bacterium]